MESRYIFVVAMDYVDKSDVKVFTVKLTLHVPEGNGFTVSD